VLIQQAEAFLHLSMDEFGLGEIFQVDIELLHLVEGVRVV
jgi:hypothetical protein